MVIYKPTCFLLISVITGSVKIMKDLPTKRLIDNHKSVIHKWLVAYFTSGHEDMSLISSISKAFKILNGENIFTIISV